MEKDFESKIDFEIEIFEKIDFFQFKSNYKNFRIFDFSKFFENLDFPKKEEIFRKIDLDFKIYFR